MGYRPPLRAIAAALDASGLGEVLQLTPFEHLDRGDVEDVLAGFGRFAAEVLAPTDRIADLHGNDFDPATGTVTTPEPVRKAFHQWIADGWSGLAVASSHGGGGMPSLVGVAAEEMFASANMALSLNPMLTQGAIHLLAEWGSDAQRARFLHPLVQGRWSGTMNLTEPDAGSDVGALRTRATPRADGRWELSGSKIFITWGEHDLTENIVHLVLARTPGSPAGSRGISLFVVPHRHLDADGVPGARNAVRCTSIEHKLGIHGSPTCVLQFDGAVGEMVGPPCGGMAAMFTMMNSARLSVGLEGLAVSERAQQQALDYAHERRQGRSGTATDDSPSPIVEHPDVRRMLLSSAASIEAMRMLLYSTAAAADLARHHPDPTRRSAMATRADLLTPMAKSWCTDEGVRLTSVAVQVHGGAGYIEETGIAQRFRDSRIAPIYEGTNGIQAIDLASRKVRRDGGAGMRALLDDLTQDVDAVASLDSLSDAVPILRDAIVALADTTTWVMSCSRDDDWLAGATPYLELASLAVCGGLLAKKLRWMTRHRPADEAARCAAQLRLFTLERVSHARAHQAAIFAGASRLDHLAATEVA